MAGVIPADDGDLIHDLFVEHYLISLFYNWLINQALFLQAVGKPDVFTGITRAAGKPMGCDLA